jgi:hypothetical protein
MARIKYTIGDEVSHMDNLNNKMRIRGFVYEDKKLRHIVCSWWSENKLEKDNFHSHELIPWGIAKQGEDQVKAYLDSISNEEMLKNFTATKQ